MAHLIVKNNSTPLRQQQAINIHYHFHSAVYHLGITSNVCAWNAKTVHDELICLKA